jgi:hypothetical protein
VVYALARAHFALQRFRPAEDDEKAPRNQAPSLAEKDFARSVGAA